MSADGTVLAECEYDTIIPAEGKGYVIAFRYQNSGDSLYTLIGTDGIICKDSDTAINQELISKKMDGNKERYLVIEDGAYSLELEEGGELRDCLVGDIDAARGLCGVYDVMSGEQLLDYEYTGIGTAYGCFYAYKDDVYTVYRINR